MTHTCYLVRDFQSQKPYLRYSLYHFQRYPSAFSFLQFGAIEVLLVVSKLETPSAHHLVVYFLREVTPVYLSVRGTPAQKKKKKKRINDPLIEANFVSYSHVLFKRFYEYWYYFCVMNS